MVTCDVISEQPVVAKNANAQYIADMRSFLDWLEANPGPGVSHDLVLVSVCSDAEWASAIRWIGKAEKGANSDFFTLKRRFGSIVLDLYRRRELVCEKVKVGEKSYPAEPAKTVEIPAKEARVEDIYEWKCPESILRETTDV